MWRNGRQNSPAVDMAVVVLRLGGLRLIRLLGSDDGARGSRMRSPDGVAQSLVADIEAVRDQRGVVVSRKACSSSDAKHAPAAAETQAMSKAFSESTRPIQSSRFHSRQRSTNKVKVSN